MPHQRQPQRTAQWWAVRLLVVVVGILVVVYVGLSFVVANVISVPPRQALVGDPKTTYGLEYEDITFPARTDGLDISAWFLPATESDRAIVLVHGKGQNRTLEFGARYLECAAALHEHDFAVVMLDMRGHGKSGDSRFTYGIREKRDVLGAVDWLRARGFAAGHIGVLGVSMGAASSIGATADEPAIGALVSDSSFAEFFPIVEGSFTNESGLPGFFLPPSLLALRVLTGEDIRSLRPVEDMATIPPRPVLIIHAQGDSLIPVSHAHQLAEAAPGSQVWIIDIQDHARTYNADPDEYVRRVVEFFDAGLEE